MYQQFKELADVDITKEPMEVGPTMHYIMGGVRVDAETQMSTLPGLFACGECAAGINGANRLGGNSLSDLLVLGQRAGDFAARFASEQAPGRIDERQAEWAARAALEPFDRGDGGEGPYRVQQDLQNMMHELVGIVRTESEMLAALEGFALLWRRSSAVGVASHREFNTAWHTALDLPNLLVVAEAITRSAIERRESRGAHFRLDYPQPDPAFAAVNVVIRAAANGEMQVSRVPIPPIPPALAAIIEEMK
jgi:succinate dehydrogenase / fumarate reductase flavoprotein subunit